MMKKNVLVTGGAGFIGSNLADALLAQGHRVVVIDNLSTGKRKNLNAVAEFHEVDMRDLDKIKPLFKGIDYVFHLAAQPRIQPSIQDPVTANSVNVTGTLNVLVAARDAGVKKFIYSASSSAYGDQEILPLVENMEARPKNPYALQKYIGELYAKLFFDLYGLSTVSLRYFNVFGPRQSFDGAYATVVGIFLRQHLGGEPMTVIGDGTMRRDFTYVGDVVRANMLAATSEKVGRGEVINIGAGNNRSVNEVAGAILKETKNSSHAITSEKYSIQLINSLAVEPVIYLPPRPGEVKETLADNQRAKELLGWEPTVNFEDGLKKLIEHGL